jgi:hypothetical protein
MKEWTLTIQALAERDHVSRAYVRKLLAQRRVFDGQGRVVVPKKVGKRFVLPIDARLPTERAEYGSLSKEQRKAWR